MPLPLRRPVHDVWRVRSAVVRADRDAPVGFDAAKAADGFGACTMKDQKDASVRDIVDALQLEAHGWMMIDHCPRTTRSGVTRSMAELIDVLIIHLGASP